MTATVCTEGATLNSYRVGEIEVIYPRREIDGSHRGGSHVCLPNFGPDSVSDQPQHGYGRLVNWDILSKSMSSVELAYTHPVGDYVGLRSVLRYCLNEEGLTMSLSLENGGNKTMLVAPGFHPYFSVSSGVTSVNVSGREYDISSLAGTEWLHESKDVIIALGVHRIKIASDNLSVIALWSADSKNYVCVEPTFAGYAHAVQGDLTHRLDPGMEFKASLVVSLIS